jgi:flagellar hook protein FlgE
MLRSMYAGISGMKGFQTKLDVIGNNIANVNTYGFKKGRMTFQDMMSQTLSGAEGPVVQNGNPLRGGINPAQVGLGSQIGSIDNIHTQGSRQTTGRPLDLALEGDGMFVLGKNLAYQTPGDTTSGVNMDDTTINFTRAGNLYLDDQGYIVNPDGMYLLGEVNGNVDRLQIPANAASFSVQKDGTVAYVDETGTVQTAGQVRLAQFSNPGGLEKVGSNAFILTNNAGVTTDDGVFNGLGDLVIPEQNGAASVVAGALEMSNVDLAEEFTEMIVAQRGFQANTRIITTSDEILQELVNLKR